MSSRNNTERFDQTETKDHVNLFMSRPVNYLGHLLPLGSDGVELLLLPPVLLQLLQGQCQAGYRLLQPGEGRELPIKKLIDNFLLIQTF